MRIVEYPDKRLLQVGKQIEIFDDTVSELVKEMFDVMYKAGGVGLAASQIGNSLSLL